MGGSAFSCLRNQTSIEESPHYDLSVIRSKNLPFIWITGQQNTGKKTHGELIRERFDFEHINITDLLRDDAKKDTNRGKFVGDCLRLKKRVSDNVVIQLIKETLVNSTNDNGFVISNFPKNSKQADLFIRDIQNVNFILYLYSDIVSLLNRAQAKTDRELDETILKKDIAYATRDIKSSLQKFIPKIENINTTGAPEIVFNKIQNAIVNRLRIQAPPSDSFIGNQPDSDVGSNEPFSATPEKPDDQSNTSALRDGKELRTYDTESNNLNEVPSEETKNGSLNSELLYDDPSSRISQISNNTEPKAEEPKIEFQPVALEVDTSDSSAILTARLPSKNIRIELPVVELTCCNENTVPIGDNEIEVNIRKLDSLRTLDEIQIEDSVQKEDFVIVQTETPNSEITSDSIPQSESLSDIPSAELVGDTDEGKSLNQNYIHNDFYQDQPPAYTPYNEELTETKENSVNKNDSFSETSLSDVKDNKVNNILRDLHNQFKTCEEQYANTILDEEIPRIAYDIYQAGQIGHAFPSELPTKDVPEEPKAQRDNNDVIVRDAERDNNVNKEIFSDDAPPVTNSNNTNSDYEI